MEDINYWVNKWAAQRCSTVFESSLMNLASGICALPTAPHMILNEIPYTCHGCPYTKIHTGGMK